MKVLKTIIRYAVISVLAVPALVALLGVALFALVGFVTYDLTR